MPFYETLNIDVLVYNLFLPFIKYPFFFLLPFKTVISGHIIYVLGVYTLCMLCFSIFNCLVQNRIINRQKWLPFDQLDSPVAIVTGGSNGLGKDLISQLLTSSQKIKIINIDIKEPNKKTLDVNRVVFQRCDLTNSLEVEKMIKDIKSRYGNQICLIINNAGMRSSYSEYNHIKDSELQRVMQINCYTPFKIIQELRPEQSSNSQCYIINIASTLGILSPAKTAVYAASKAALICITNSLKFELNTQNCSNTRILLVIVGQLNTNMFNGFKAPRQFFAPVVDTKQLAKKLIDCSMIGRQRVIYEPLYANFAYLLMSMPLCIQNFVRSFSKMDTCLPTEN